MCKEKFVFVCYVQYSSMDIWYDMIWLKYTLVRSNEYRGYFCIKFVEVGYKVVRYWVIRKEYNYCMVIWECVGEGDLMYGDGLVYILWSN